MKIFKRSLLAALTFVFLWIVFNWELVSYAGGQAYGQLAIIWNARPVEQVLNDSEFADSLKTKLKFIQEVRKYAIDSLGLKDTRNYKTLYDQKGKEIMWVVTASEPFRLKPKEWRFPILGSVPYKGFFDETKALQLKQQLKKEGWDVNVRNPGGWSTLGWFTDPILSKMLERSEGDLASLIIHEMVHATIFVKDSVDFNENLASFIGDRGAEKFLITRYGIASEQYKKFIEEDHDYVKYVDHVLRGTTLLDSMYSAMPENMPLAEKLILKQNTIRRIVDSMDTLALSSSKKPSLKFKNKLPNNAYFMSFIHYQSGQSELLKEWKEKFNGDLKVYIAFLSERYPFL